MKQSSKLEALRARLAKSSLNTNQTKAIKGGLALVEGRALVEGLAMVEGRAMVEG